MKVSLGPVADAIRLRARGRGHGRLIAAVGVPAIAALMLAGGAVAVARGYEGRIGPGVHVGRVDLSGLTPAAAHARLVDAFGGLGSGELEVSAGATHVAIGYADLGRRIDADATVARAMHAGPAGPLAILEGLAGGVTSVDPVVTIDQAAVQRHVHSLALAAGEQSRSASVAYGSSGFVVIAARPGTGLDEAALAEKIRASLATAAAPARLSLAVPLHAAAPSVTDAMAGTAAATAARMATDVVVTDGAARWTIPAKTIATWVGFSRAPTGYAPSVAPDAPSGAVKALAAKIDVPAVNAGFVVGSDGKTIRTTPSRNGRSVDVAATSAAIAAAVDARATPGTGALPNATVAVSLTFATTQPRITTAEAERVAPQMAMVSSWTTHYDVGPQNGYGANITIPARTINGFVVAPGQQFSFWGAVGEVSTARGYSMGGAIINGHSQEQGAIGGGICSASTTLFNAALRGGYQIDDRANHYYYISRYPVGLDATVFASGGSVQDMRWTNDTPYPVLVRSFGSPGVVTFELWSVPNGRHVSLSTVTANHHYAADTVRRTTALPAGVRERVEYPANGFDAWVTWTVTGATGAVVHRQTFASHYATVTGVLEVGAGYAPAAAATRPAAPSPAPASPAPTATPTSQAPPPPAR